MNEIFLLIYVFILFSLLYFFPFVTLVLTINLSCLNLGQISFSDLSKKIQLMVGFTLPDDNTPRHYVSLFLRCQDVSILERFVLSSSEYSLRHASNWRDLIF